MKQRYFPLTDYPELLPVMKQWEVIRDEGTRCRRDMIWIEDDRMRVKKWAFAPLRPEKEDSDPDLEALGTRLRSLCPNTVNIVSKLPGVLAYGYSLLIAGAKIGVHSHANPYVTAMLGLSCDEKSWITVDNRRCQIQPGHLLIFDYTLPHESINAGTEDRLVLLMLLPNKSFL